MSPTPAGGATAGERRQGQWPQRRSTRGRANLMWPIHGRPGRERRAAVPEEHASDLDGIFWPRPRWGPGVFHSPHPPYGSSLLPFPSPQSPWLRRPPARRPALYCLLLRRLTWWERASSGLVLVGEEGIEEISTSSIVTICERRKRHCWPPKKPLGRESRAPASTTPPGSRCRWASRPLQRWLAATYVARGSEMGTNWLGRGGHVDAPPRL